MHWSISCFLILACHVYFMLCSILFLRCFSFCLSFISHLCCTPQHPFLVLFFHFFPSFFLAPLSIHVKKGESILESLLDSCTFIGGKIPKGRCIYQRGENIFYKKTLFSFVLHYVCFLVFLYGTLSFYWYLCFVVLIALCLCAGHA